MIVGVVLAGGRSTRMGRDKAAIEVAPGERLVDRVVAAVRAALAAAGDAAPRVVVSGRVHGHECVDDDAPGLGPVGGIAAAVRWARSPAGGGASVLLVVPVDLPAIAPDALAPLLGAVPPATYAGTALPALLRVDGGTAAAIEETLAASGRGRSVLALVTRLGARELPLDPAHARALTGANTPSELEQALRPAARPAHGGAGTGRRR